jgi:hypothetical protein
MEHPPFIWVVFCFYIFVIESIGICHHELLSFIIELDKHDLQP